MATPTQLNALSILALVASDAAYQPKSEYDAERAAGGPVLLQSFPDSAKLASEQGVPSSLVAALPNGANDLTAYQLAIRNGSREGGPAQTVTFTNWTLIRKFQNPGDGFGAAVFRSKVPNAQGKYEHIVAFQGSDGLDGQDWFANLDLARKVWTDNGPAVINFLVNGDIGDDGVNYAQSGLRPSEGIVHFTGQSLGGGLAQYGAYFYAKQLDSQGQASNLAERMSLIEFNGFGAVAGIDDLLKKGFNGVPLGSRYDATVLANVPTLHYAIKNELVHRLGTGDPRDLAALGGSWHVNGAGNSYEYDFRRFEGGSVAPGRNLLNPVDAHRIESGFYRGFANYGIDFTDPTLIEKKPYAYIDTRLIQGVGVLLSRVFSDGTTTDLSARGRLAVGLLGGASLGPVSDYENLKSEIVEAFYASGDIDDAARAALSVGASAITVKTLLNAGLGAIAKPLGVLGWLFSIGLELFKSLTAEEKQGAVEEFNSLLPSDRQIQYQSIDDRQASAADRALRYEIASLYALQYADPADTSVLIKTEEQRELVAGLANANTDPNEFGAKLVVGEHWIKNTFDYIGQAIASSATLTTNDKQLAIQRFALELSRDARLVAGADLAFLDRVRGDLNAFLRSDLAVAIATANPDVISNETTSLTLDPTTSFRQVRELADAFLDGLKQFGAEAIGLLTASGEAAAADVSQLEEYVQSAAQTVVILPGRSSNPFDDPTFDPEASPVAAGNVVEGSVSTFTAYLPYEAGAGGQRVRLELAGLGVEKLSALAGGEEIELAADGRFALTLAEGQREATFSLVAGGDFDAGAAFTLSAQLVALAGGVEVATHLEREEATITLDAETETAPTGGLEYHGDWAVKYYPVMNADGTPGVDERGVQMYASRVDSRYPVHSTPGIQSQ